MVGSMVAWLALHGGGTLPKLWQQPAFRSGKHPFTFNKRLYKLRWRIEASFNRLKDFRPIAPLRQIGAKLSRLCLRFCHNAQQTLCGEL
jgi:transposase